MRKEKNGVDERGVDDAGGVEVVFRGVSDQRCFWGEVLEEEFSSYNR